MDNNFEDDGFEVVKKPEIRTKTKPKLVVLSQKEEAPKEKIIVVSENQGVLDETRKTNGIMHSAISEIAETMKSIGARPKRLICKDIKRNTTGMMTGFEIDVIYEKGGQNG